MQPRLLAPLIGRYVYQTMKKEEKRMAAGWTLEPETFLEKNQAVLTEAGNAAAETTPPRESVRIQDLAGVNLKYS